MLKKGTLVLMPFPFTDLSGNKLRPALVISKVKDENDLTVIFISSKKQKRTGKFDIFIKSDNNNRLKVDSVIKCSKIATLDKKVFIGELGSVSLTKIREVDNKLKKLLGLD